MHFTYINNGIDISIFKPAEKKVLLRKKLSNKMITLIKMRMTIIIKAK